MMIVNGDAMKCKCFIPGLACNQNNHFSSLTCWVIVPNQPKYMSNIALVLFAIYMAIII